VYSCRHAVVLKVLTAIPGEPVEAIDSEATNEWMHAGAERAGIDLRRRAETLSIQEFATFSNNLFPSRTIAAEGTT